MTYEQLIITIDAEAPFLSNIAYKLLWRLIAMAMSRGTTEVHVSQRWLAGELRRSKESLANATDELAKVLTITRPDGQITTYSLPPEWFPPQRTLFSEDQLCGNVSKRPGNQATTDLETKPPLTWKPGHQRAGNQATWAGNQATGDLETRPRDLETRPLWAGNQATSHDGAREDTRARVESNRIEVAANSEGYLVIEKAFHTVEIWPNQREDAEILSDVILSHRINFDSAAGASSQRDSKVLARLLAIAPLERLCDTIAALQAEGLGPGKSDMWYFAVFLNRIHGIHHTVTDAVIRQIKTKTPSLKANAPLFEDSLLHEVGPKLRRLG